MDTLFTYNPQWHDKIGRIYALLERVKIAEEQSGNSLHLRRMNRILSVQATTAIEGNHLTVEQVSAIIDGKPVWGQARDIKEVQNALSVYELIPDFTPFSIDDFLKAHRIITSGLAEEAGMFRTVSVAVKNSQGKKIHTGSHFSDVSDLVNELFEWGRQADVHPLLKSSAVHFMIEYIHPFRDGNGRFGRLWQTLLLYHWNSLFEWFPVETLIYHNQQRYYQVLQESRADGIDARPFIDFMLEIIEDALIKNINATDGRVNGSVSGSVKSFDEKLKETIEKNPGINTPAILQQLGGSERTVRRHLKVLCDNQEIEFRGAPKNGGYWVNTKQ
ncbi:cell filamentation protein Fic [Planctomycetales bacterium]|nr:cell filamentation protein Fic [Planctomycetales bacterium]